MTVTPRCSPDAARRARGPGAGRVRVRLPGHRPARIRVHRRRPCGVHLQHADQRGPRGRARRRRSTRSTRPRAMGVPRQQAGRDPQPELDLPRLRDRGGRRHRRRRRRRHRQLRGAAGHHAVSARRRSTSAASSRSPSTADYVPITPVAGIDHRADLDDAHVQHADRAALPMSRARRDEERRHVLRAQVSIAAAVARRSAGQALVVMVGVMLLSIVAPGRHRRRRQRRHPAAHHADRRGQHRRGGRDRARPAAGRAARRPFGWDATVAAKVAASAAANNMTVKAAYYTDICGIPLQANGAGALNANGTENLALALQVGTGAPARAAPRRPRIARA